MLTLVFLILFSLILFVLTLRNTRSSNFISILSILLYFAFFTWGYRYIITTVFGYAGFIWQPNLYKVISSIALVILFGLLIPSSINKPSSYFLQFWFMFAYIPLLVMFALANADGRYIITVTICLMFMLVLQKSIPLFYVQRLPGGRQIALSLIFGITIATYLFLIMSHGFRFGISLDEVYVIREQFRVISANLFLGGYLPVWQGYVINPLILGLGIYRKNPFLIVLSIVLTVLIVSISGIKNFLTGIILIPMILFLLKMHTRSKTIMALGLGIVVGLSAITFLYGNIIISSLTIRRLFFLPAFIQLRFFEFFSNNPKAFLGHSVLSPFVNYPYDLPPSGLVANYINPDTFSGANTGFLGDAFANFGYSGMIAFSFLLVFLLRFADGIADQRGLYLVLLPLAMPLFAIINSALLTSLVTHGILLGLLVGWLLTKRHTSLEITSPK